MNDIELGERMLAEQIVTRLRTAGEHVMAAHQDVAQWLTENWGWLLLWAWLLGGFEEAGRWWRRVQRRRQNAVEARRQHELDLAKVQAHGTRMAQPYPDVPPPGKASASLPPAAPTAVEKAKDELRLRYARGEITREEFLQAKVELEDL